MISEALYALTHGIRGLLKHPRMLFVLMLAVVFPLALMQLAQQFLAIGVENFETLQRSRIGAIHDAAHTAIAAYAPQAEKLQESIESLVDENTDITKMRIARLVGQDVEVIAALDQTELGLIEDETETETYRRAFLEVGTAVSFEFTRNDIPHWQTFSMFTDDDLTIWFVFTEQSFENFTQVVEAREFTAYALLFVTYLFLLGLAYWQIKDIDYRAKYVESQTRLSERDQFANVIAHELRTPLTAMRGYASLIEESPDATAHIKEHALRIRESTERQVRLVNDFLEVARLQAGTFKIEPAEVNLNQLITRVTDELAQLAAEKQLKLSFDNPEQEIIIESDTARLEQVFRNLISNSVKYTKQGRVVISLRDRGQKIEVRVKDTGSGISSADQKRLFAPFFRVQNEDTKKITGSGLGMWITRRLVERMGGSIGIESIKDVGTNVVISLPKKLTE